MITAKKIHLVGIGGIGMSALARLFLGLGKEVSGSDIKDSSILEDLRKLGIKILIGHDPGQIKQISPDLVMYSADITEESAGFAELQFAKESGIAALTYAESLGHLMNDRYGIAVTGTNGKSTTTAILALILEAAGLDPMALVGTQISASNTSNEFVANARIGSGKYFVAEADEYQRKMLTLKPQMIVLTNVAEDHLDYYKDLADVEAAFIEFVKSLPKDGMVIFNADDHNTTEVVHHATSHRFSFGIHHYADLQALNVRQESGKQIFDMHLNDQAIGTFEMQVPGKFNILNALGAALAALKLGVSVEVIKKTLKDFKGTWRRFEKVGEMNGKIIISDYGHHPAGIAVTLEAAKEFYPGKKILLVFQPHHRNRTKRLFGEFVEALTSAQSLILPEIFEVSGREHGEQISSQDLVTELRVKGVDATFAADLAQTEQMVRDRAKDFDVIIMMGAGDIDLTARKLVT